ncbi:MAG: hypothetical protein ACI9U2_001740 [Bradymonadia bacterium]
MSKPRQPIQRVKGALQWAQEAAQRRTQRYRASGLRFALADRIDYFNPDAWDAVAKHGSLYLDRRYLRAIEGCTGADIEPRYALLFDEDEPVAAVSAQRVRIQGARLKPDTPPDELPLAEALGRLVRDRLLDCLDDTMLVCGNMYGGGPTGAAVCGGVDPTRVWSGVAESLYRIRRADKLVGDPAFVLFKDVDPSVPSAALHRFSYRPIDTEPEMVLALDPAWRTFDDYLAALNKKYRAAARKVHKTLAAANVQVVADDRETSSAALNALYQQVLSRAESTPVVLPSDYFERVHAALGEDARITTLSRDGALLGFVMTLRDGDTAIGHFVGIDYTVELPIYFRLLHAVIEAGMAFGCTQIQFGRTALDAKARLGALPVPQQVWCRHRHGALNLVIRELFSLVDPAEAPERNPFK